MTRKNKHEPKWTPFERGVYNRDGILKRLPAEVREDAGNMSEMTPDGCYRNSRYTVFTNAVETPIGDMMHLSIKRNDQREIKDWRDLQRIKNEIAGPECEAVELYPQESRLVDTSNQYHLWCLPSDIRFPFGYGFRIVSDGEDTTLGSKQRSFDDDVRPADCVDAAAAINQYKEAVTRLCDNCGLSRNNHVAGLFCPNALHDAAQFTSKKEEIQDANTTELDEDGSAVAPSEDR